jgi:hypothetical protein
MLCSGTQSSWFLAVKPETRLRETGIFDLDFERHESMCPYYPVSRKSTNKMHLETLNFP